MKILVFRNSNFGDYFISIPVLRLLRKKFKNCNITYLTIKNREKFSLPLKIGDEQIVDNFFLIDKKDYRYFKNLRKIIEKIKKKKFDKLIYLQEYSSIFSLLKHYIFFYFTGIPEIIGFKYYFYKRSYSKESETIQIARRIFQNLKKKTIISSQFLKSYNEKKIIRQKYFTIGPGGFALGRLPDKIKTFKPIRWKNENWIKLCQKLISRYKNIKIVITGTKKERLLSKKLRKKFRYNIIDKCGKTSVNEWINIIKYTELHICQDNGSMHLATLFQKKNIALFNNHDFYGKWFPLNKNSYVIRLEGDINTIELSHIFRGIKKLIKK